MSNPVTALLSAQENVAALLEREPVPDSMGRCADTYHDVREIRLLAEKGVERLKAYESKLREHMVNNLSKSADTGAAGLRYRVQIVTKRAAKVADWGVFASWVRKNDRFDCFQKRINEKAVMETMEAEGRVLPGVEVVNIPDVSVTKI